MKTNDWKLFSKEKPEGDTFIFIVLKKDIFKQPKIACYSTNISMLYDIECKTLYSENEIFAWLPMPKFTIDNEAELTLQDSSFYNQTFHTDYKDYLRGSDGEPVRM